MKGLGRDPVSGDHSPAPCFSRSVVELAGPELSFDSSVGSETKIQLVIKTLRAGKKPKFGQA
jgi:hypothetical protein